MVAFLDKLCAAYFYGHPEVFGSGTSIAFAGFGRSSENDYIPVSVAGLRYTYVHGRIEYRLASEIRFTAELLVKHFDSLGQAAGADDVTAFARETAFLRWLAPALERVKRVSGLPKLCASRVAVCGAANQKALLFESPAGVLRFACRSFPSDACLSLMVRQIAELHCAYWLARRVDPAFWPEARYTHVPYAQPERVLPLLRRCFDSIEETARNRAGMRRLRRTLDEFEERLRAPFSWQARNASWTMCHQMYGQENVVFEYNRNTPIQLRIFNWQSMGFASLGVDLVIVLFVEQRCRRGDKAALLVREYWEALHEVPEAERPTMEAICAEVKRCVSVALYVLADRVLRASSRTQLDGWLYSIGCWNEALIVSLLRFLMTSDFI